MTIHAEIESHTPALITAYSEILAGLRAGSVPAVKAGLTALREVQEGIVVSQLKVRDSRCRWARSCRAGLLGATSPFAAPSAPTDRLPHFFVSTRTCCV